MNIDALQAVETCCAFFAPGFLEQIALDLTSPVEAALDAPDRIAPPMAYLSALHRERERTLTRYVWNSHDAARAERGVVRRYWSI